MAQPQAIATQPPLLSHPYVQTLERQLDTALRKIREYEDTILHQATVSRQSFYSLRTHHGIICPDCKQEVAHTCSSATQSSLQLPPIRHEHQPSSALANLTGLQTHLSGPTAQGNPFRQQVTAQSASASFDASVSHVRPLPPSSSVFTSHSTNPYPLTSLPDLTVPSSSGAMPYYPTPCLPLPSIPIHSHYNSSNSNSRLEKRVMHCTDLDCEPQRKRARQNFQEEGLLRTDHSPSFNNSFSLFATTSSAPTLPSTPESHATTSEGGHVTSDQESEVDWSIQYNSEVERALDVTLVRSLDTGPEVVYSLTVSKDGKYLAVGCNLGKTNIYDVQTGEKTCTLRDIINGKDLYIWNVCFSPDGLYLATLGDELVRIWELSKKRIRNVLSSSEGISDDMVFSPVGRVIITSNCHDGLEIWNWRDGSRKVFECHTHPYNIRFSPDGKYTAVAADHEVVIYNVRTAQLVEKFGNFGLVTSIAFTPDGTGLVNGNWDGSVKLWDIGLLGMDGSGSQSQNGRVLHQHGSHVHFVAVSSNGRWVVSCSENRKVCIWDAHNAELHCELQRSKGHSTLLLDFSPVGGCLAQSFWKDNQVLLWKIT